MSTEAITLIRSLFVIELTTNASLYHPVDIQRMRTEDWQIRRYLLEHPSDQTLAYQSLLSTLQWKKSFGLHDRSDQYFPRELWEMTHVEMVGHDRAGHVINWDASRDVRSFPELSTLVRQFAAHVMERADRAAGQSGIVTITDTAGTSVFTVNRSMQQFKVSILKHFPGAFKAFYIVDSPWVLNTLFKWILGWMNPEIRELVQFVTAEEIGQLVDQEWIPLSMRGGVREPVQLPNLVTLEEQARDLGLNEAFVDNFYQTLQRKRPSVQV